MRRRWPSSASLVTTSGVDLTFATHLVPTFRSSCPVVALTFHELRKVMGTSKQCDSSAAFRFEVPESNSPITPQELQIGGISRGLESECQILNSTRILYLPVVF